MKRDNTPWQPVSNAVLDWDQFEKEQQGSPRSRQFGDLYYSRDNGMEESRYVFLLGNNLPERLKTHPRESFCVGETGFGTGLNFLLTWQAWRSLPSPRPKLNYLSVEKFPLTAADLARALSSWPELRQFADQLLANYPPAISGCHRLQFENGEVSLDLWWEDAADALSDLASRDEALVDAWYLDGFAPALNESMWQGQVLEAVASLSRPGASFATFTAAGQVRRDLVDAGFDVEKTPGFGRKRERLKGCLRERSSLPTPTETPWDLCTVSPSRPDRVLVIGGGLAGCTTAAALACRGIPVTLLERNSLAGEGSGNQQGILYTRLSRRHSPLADFALSSFCFASRLYATMLARGELIPGVDGRLCGSFHQNSNDREMAYLSRALESLPELGQVLDAEQASEILGIEQGAAGYWFPGSGWLRPVSVCQALAAAPGVEFIEHCGEIVLHRENDRWHAMVHGEPIASASCAVLATGNGARSQAGLEWLPLQAIRGQTTQLPTSPALSALQAALCHEGYIAPAREGEHCIGATFDLRDHETDQRETDHARNLQALAQAVPAWRGDLDCRDIAELAGRVGYRCASPDYLPIVGPAPDFSQFLQDFAALRKNARQILPARSPCMPGLYLNTAHGSRGLSSTPLAAEYLASTICGECPPLGRELGRALSPARFIIRDLGRNKL